MSHYNKPMAAAGLTSYRYPLPGGQYAMIGAKDDADALREAERTTKDATLDKLERWDGSEYVTVLKPNEEVAADLYYVGAYAADLKAKVNAGTLGKADAALATRMLELAQKTLREVNLRTGPW